MKSTVANLRADALEVAAADRPVNGTRDGPDPRQFSVQAAEPSAPMDENRQEITLKAFHVVLHPGLHRPSSATLPRPTISRVIAHTAGRPVSWGCSRVAAGMQARRRRELRVVATLGRLDDVTLKDLGICRCEIEYLARTQTSGKWRA